MSSVTEALKTASELLQRAAELETRRAAEAELTAKRERVYQAMGARSGPADSAPKAAVAGKPAGSAPKAAAAKPAPPKPDDESEYMPCEESEEEECCESEEEEASPP